MSFLLAYGPNAGPAFTSAATITGTLEAGQTLTCTWRVVRARDRNVTCRWFRHTADDGTDPTGVLLGTGTTYTLTGTDVGNYIRAIVTAINPAGTVQSTTSYTAAITSAEPPTPPTITTAAVITGTADVDETLTVTADFDGETSITYQWYSYTTEPTGSPLAGEDEVTLGTASTQLLTASEAGRWIVAVATATNAAGSAVTSASVAMAGVDPYAPIAPAQYTVPAFDVSALEKIYAYEGDDLQAKINLLRPGKCLVIEAGATFTGKFRVPRTYLSDTARIALGDAWAYIISSDLLAEAPGLPAEGGRVSQAHAAYMPKVQNTTTPGTARSVITIERDETVATITYASTSSIPPAYSTIIIQGANEPEWNGAFTVLAGTATQATFTVPNDLPPPTGTLQWRQESPQSFALGIDDGVSKLRVAGLEITTTYNDWNGIQVHLVFAGKSAQDETTSAYYGEEIVLDRCYIHSNPNARSQCGVLLYKGCGKVAVIGCDIEWFHGSADANGVWVLQSPGPTLIHNNRIVTAGENIFMAGNSTPGTTWPEGELPRDVTITKNYIAHRTEYDPTHPDYAYPGRTISTKNLIESKGSKRVLVQGNVFYRGRGDGSQQGCPWMHQNVGGDGVWDVDFRDNLAVDCGSITLANPFSYGRPWGYQRLRFFNNLFYNPYSLWSSVYVGTNIVDDACGYITFKNNTWVYPGNPPNAILFFAQTPTESARITGLVFEDNIIREGRNAGIGASGGANGRPAPLFHCPGGFDFNNNVVVGGQAAQYGTQYDDWRNWSRPSGNSLVGYVDDTFNELADFALSVGSPYKGAALDGASDIGADISAIQAQINASDNPFGA